MIKSGRCLAFSWPLFFCIVTVLLSVSLAKANQSTGPGVAGKDGQNQTNQSVLNDTNNFSGLYEGPDGDQIYLYFCTNSSSWVMGPAEGRNNSMTLFLSGNHDQLALQGVIARTQLNGRDMRMSAEGQQIYARTEINGEQMEIVSDPARGIQVKGPEASSDDPTIESSIMEAKATMEDFGKIWQRMQSTHMSISSNGLTMSRSPSGDERAVRFMPKRALDEAASKQMNGLLDERNSDIIARDKLFVN